MLQILKQDSFARLVNAINAYHVEMLAHLSRPVCTLFTISEVLSDLMFNSVKSNMTELCLSYSIEYCSTSVLLSINLFKLQFMKNNIAKRSIEINDMMMQAFIVKKDNRNAMHDVMNADMHNIEI